MAASERVDPTFTISARDLSEIRATHDRPGSIARVLFEELDAALDALQQAEVERDGACAARDRALEGGIALRAERDRMRAVVEAVRGAGAVHLPGCSAAAFFPCNCALGRALDALDREETPRERTGARCTCGETREREERPGVWACVECGTLSDDSRVALDREEHEAAPASGDTELAAAVPREAYARLWSTLAALIDDGTFTPSPDFAEWFYCEQPDGVLSPVANASEEGR